MWQMEAVAMLWSTEGLICSTAVQHMNLSIIDDEISGSELSYVSNSKVLVYWPSFKIESNHP